jgi:hypothetical protein
MTLKLFKPSRRHRHSIMTTARWETPYVAEWLSYHRAIGFDHIYLYCNDDDAGDLYTACAPWLGGSDPFVTFVHCPHQGQQWWMFMHFLQTYKQETEWVAFFDLDEFLSLRRDPAISQFMARHGPSTDCIYFYWTFFGHAGFAERPVGSVLRQYTRRQPGLSPYTKTLIRTSAIDPSRIKPEYRGRFTHFHHGWVPETSTPGLRVKDVLGSDMTGYWPDSEASFARMFEGPDGEERTAQVFSEAVLHHYAFRSRADFRRRVDRGLGGDFARQVIWAQREDEGGADAFLSYLDSTEDRTLADYWSAWLQRRTAGLGMYGPAPSGPLISRNKPARVSSTWFTDGPDSDPVVEAAKAVDGRPLTGRFAFHTAIEDAPWFLLDLGGPHRIEEVRLFNRIDEAEVVERASSIGISVSPDGVSWDRVFTKTDPTPFGGADGRPLAWRPRRPVEARWVRVEMLRRGVLHLEQVEVFGWSS